MKSTENQCCEQFSAAGKRVWQSSALVIPTKTLNTDLAPVGDDIELTEAPREDVEMGHWEMKNYWKRRFPEQERIPRIPRVERNKNIKIQDMLFTEIGVRHVSKVEEPVDNIELNCWRITKEKERLRCCLR